MSRIFFISDAHLGLKEENREKEREERLTEFLKYVEKNGDGLTIVGDLFDFWFEYRSVVPRRYFSIVFALKTMVNQGINVDYVTGNHDFWISSFFENELGIKVHRDPLEMVVNGKRLYVAHGDGLAKKDVGYRMIKRILRHPLNIRLYRLVHPDLGFALALFFSKLSRDHREIKNRDDEYKQYAKARFVEGFDAVVLAHTHRPQEFHENGRTYINIGDWMNHFTYGKFEGGRLSLEYWQKQANDDLDGERRTTSI